MFSNISNKKIEENKFNWETVGGNLFNIRKNFRANDVISR
jgi:hypothetical protein